MSQRNHHPTVRRIVLPSGRSIEVIRFNEVEPRVRELYACPACQSELVQPLSWSECEEGRWELTLECPNCWWMESDVYERGAVERLEDRLDQGLADIIADLKRLSQANMAADVDRLISALEADLILPEDF